MSTQPKLSRKILSIHRNATPPRMSYVCASAKPLYRYFLLLTLLLLRLPQTGYSQMSLSLPKAFEILEKQNPELLQANLTRLLAQQDYRDAKNALLPQVNMGVSHNYNLGLAFDQIAGQLVTGNKWSNTANANISVGTTIFQGFAKINNIRLAQLQLEREDVSIAVKKKALKLELLSYYFEALTNTELYNASKQQRDLSLAQLAQTRVEYDLGMKTTIDISLIENQVANDELRVLNSRSAIDERLLSIKEVLSIPLEDSILLELPDIIAANHDQISMDTLHHTAEMQLARLQTRTAELQIRMQKNAYLPTIQFTTGYGTNYSSERREPIGNGYMPFLDQVNQNKSLYLGLSLNIPILNGFRARSNMARATINLEQAKVDQQQTAINQRKTYKSAQLEYRTALKQYQLYQKQASSTSASYDAMKERYDLGLTTAMDLAKTLLDYNLSELNVIRAKYLLLYHQEVLKILKE